MTGSCDLLLPHLIPCRDIQIYVRILLINNAIFDLLVERITVGNFGQGPFFGRTGVFKFRALHLQSRHSTALAKPPVHFALVIFGDGGPMSYLSGLTLNLILLISASQVVRIIDMSY
jgi:hypothetical protein